MQHRRDGGLGTTEQRADPGHQHSEVERLGQVVVGSQAEPVRLGAILPNLRYAPEDLIRAMPVLVLGLAGLGCVAWQWLRLRRADGEQGGGARRDFAVALALASSWLGVWGLYSAYTWTARPGIGVWPTSRFYVPAIGAIALLGAWLVVRGPLLAPSPRRTALAVAASAIVVVALFVLGSWSFSDMLRPQNPGSAPHHCNIGEPHCQATPPADRPNGPSSEH